MIYQLLIFMRKSEGTLNLAGTQAARADINTFDFTIHHSADTLNVRLPGTFRLQMRMADIIARQLALCTNFANTCHVLHLLTPSGHIAPTHNIGILTQIVTPCKENPNLSAPEQHKVKLIQREFFLPR